MSEIPCEGVMASLSPHDVAFGLVILPQRPNIRAAICHLTDDNMRSFRPKTRPISQDYAHSQLNLDRLLLFHTTLPTPQTLPHILPFEFARIRYHPVDKIRHTHNASLSSAIFTLFSEMLASLPATTLTNCADNTPSLHNLLSSWS